MFRVLRFAVTVAVCLAGCSFGVVTVPASGLALVACVGAAAGFTVQHRSTRAELWSPPEPGSFVLAGLLGAVIVTAVVGLVAGIGWSGLAVSGFTLAMWPAAVRGLIDLLPADDTTRVPGSSRRRPVPGRQAARRNWPARLRTMSDGSVCYAWGISSQRLKAGPPAAEHLALVLNRAYLLDELERRDPDGFANWTTSGPGLTLDPRRFINSSAGPDGREPEHDHGGS